MRTLTESIYDIDESKMGDAVKAINDYFKNNTTIQKIKEIASDVVKKSGKQLLIQILELYYFVIDPHTPIKSKLLALGPLLYFINPVDAVPDMAPTGFVDDLAVVASAFEYLRNQITDDIKEKANQTYHRWFPNDTQEKEVQ